MKVLDLYAGLGGNRLKWRDVEVIAVEMDERIAKVYQDHFPDDHVVIGDAHQYLLDHYQEFDFILVKPTLPESFTDDPFRKEQESPVSKYEAIRGDYLLET